ncbi:DUF4097 family beta strand repeat protein [Viridibacillus sp. YIM B01967]|uniref:DUF4097 family beta strand repeat protein n=1 Tax=Viridibacillus soli TaxID=2798301 RepID=A0ABS1H387_9BACL|nr:DUF4097 family beta strand repeat-containing protein [Viridibacillus soli]MBK3493876.1 DUF4097 family beta strand repeat protein [Viridibacillus soli]
MIIAGSLIALNSGKKNVGYKSELENVDKILVDADVSNIVAVSGDSKMNIEYTSQKSLFGNSKIDIVYEKDRAIIKVKAKWINIVTKRGELVLNLPPRILEHVQIKTRNGNIDVKNLSEVNRLSLSSSVGNINVDSFKGESLNIEAKNGSMNIGAVDGEVNIKNRIGSLNSLNFSDIKGKNNINLSNGNVKITLPNGLKSNKVGLNISTSNGKLITENNILSSENKIKRGAGQKIINGTKGDKELNISVSVGNIIIN